MKALLPTLALLGAVAIFHPPVANAEESSTSSNALTSELATSESRLFYNRETGHIVRVGSDGSIIDVDPSTVRIRDLRSEAVAADAEADDSESLVHRRRYRHRHHRHHRYYPRYRSYGRYYGYSGDAAAGRVFGMVLGGLFYAAVDPCGPIRYNPWYCWY